MSEKFEKHNDMLFRILDKPVPLTEDTNMPCLVRFRMPFSDRFRGKHEGVAFFCDAIKKNPLYGNRLYAYETRRVGCIAEPIELEIIGTFVKEGSPEWAWYQMVNGEKICHKKFPSIIYCKHASKIMREVRYNCVDHMSVPVWLNGADKNGWQIYKEPKPESQYKVGDWVDCKDFVGVPAQCKVLEIQEHNVIVECKTGHIWSLPHNNITRKLSPSEVIVNIGCMSGTVEDLSYVEDSRFWFIGKKTERCPGGMHAILYGEMLDTPTRELVESLLKAQEEEK